MAMNVNVKEQLGNKITAEFNCHFSNAEGYGHIAYTIYGPPLIIGGLVSVKLKMDIKHNKSHNSNDSIYCDLLVQCQNHQHNTLQYECKLFKDNSGEPFLITHDSNSHWNTIEKNVLVSQLSRWSFRLTFIIELKSSSTPKFYDMYNNEDLADFKLCAEDGTITVHRFVLAAHSPVLKTMLTGTWKETKEGRVNVTGTTAQTLEQLKKYLYLDELPDTIEDLEPLLVLSAVYMMKDLALKCSAKILLHHLTPENAAHFLQLACQYNIKTLLLGITSANALNMDMLSLSCDDEKWL